MKQLRSCNRNNTHVANNCKRCTCTGIDNHIHTGKHSPALMLMMLRTTGDTGAGASVGAVGAEVGKLEGNVVGAAVGLVVGVRDGEVLGRVEGA